MKKFAETTIANSIYREIFENQHIGWDLSMSQDGVKAVLLGCASYLSEVKSKEKKRGCRLDMNNGTFAFGAYVSWVPNDEDETKGSWSLNFTFDEEELKGIPCENLTNPMFKHTMSTVALEKVGLGFKQFEGIDYMPIILSSCINSVKEYMRENVNIENEVQLDDLCTFNSEMDGDAVYVAVVPSPVLKQYIKDDAGSEEAVEDTVETKVE